MRKQRPTWCINLASFVLQRFDWLYPAYKWRAHDNRSWWWVRVAIFMFVLIQFYYYFSSIFILLTDLYISLFCLPSIFSTTFKLCVSLECQQEEASQHGEAGSRLPWWCRTGAASLGGLGSGPSELGYCCLRCLWLWESSSEAFQ